MRIVERRDNGWVLMESEPVKTKVPLMVKARGLHALFRWLLRKYVWYQHPTKMEEREYVASVWVRPAEGKPLPSLNLETNLTPDGRVMGASLRTKDNKDGVFYLGGPPSVQSWPIGEGKPAYIGQFEEGSELSSYVPTI